MDLPRSRVRDATSCLVTADSVRPAAARSVDLRVLQNKVQKAIEAASMTVLRNADHSRTLGDGLWKSYKAGHLVDIVVHCHGHSTRAHRVVLSVYSPVLRASMAPQPPPKPTLSIADDAVQQQQEQQQQQQQQQSMHVAPPLCICLDDVVHRARDLDILLEFMYRGEVSLPKTGLQSLLRTAEILEIWSLVDAIKARSDDLEHDLEEQQPPEGGAMVNDDDVIVTDACSCDDVVVVDQMIIKLEPPDHHRANYEGIDDFEDIDDDGGGGTTPIEMAVESLLDDDDNRVLDGYFKYDEVKEEEDDVVCVDTGTHFDAVQVQQVPPPLPPQLENDLLDGPKKKARFRCQYCGKAFSSNQAYVVHHKEHADPAWRQNRENRCPTAAAAATYGDSGDAVMINQLLAITATPPRGVADQGLVPIQLIKSNKGKDLLVHQDYIYRLDRIRGTSRYWRCNQYDSCKCKARSVTIDNNVSEVRGMHNHPPEKATVKAKQINANIKDLAKTAHESIESFVASMAAGIQPSVSSLPSTLPKETTIRRIVRRSRHTDTMTTAAAPSSPANLRELAIPHLYSTTLNDEDFLLFDSGPSDDRIVLFSTNHNLQLLQNTPDWYADCSLRLAPPLFRQLYTIHAICHGEVVPAVYLLLPDRRRETYERAFDALRSLRPNLNPKTIVTDPESRETIGALEACFEDAVYRGCRFHFCQSLWQQVQRHHQHCLDDAQFTSHLRRLLCLCFVPPDQVAAKFDELCSSKTFRDATDCASVMPTLLEHFEETYVGRRTRQGERQAPTLKPDLWNYYRAVVAGDHDQEDRSIAINDSIECWHRRFVALMSRCIDCPRPSIWKFIVKLKEEQARNDQLILRNLAGVWPTTSALAAATKRVANMRAIVQDFANRSLEDYLTALSSYIDFCV